MTICNLIVMLGRVYRPNVRSHITSGQIKDNTVDGADIKDETIESVDIMDDTVASIDILDGTVASVDIKDDTVASVDIKDGTVASVDIKDDTVARVDIVAGLLPPIGALMMWSALTAPTGYLVCDGASVSRTTYADLFDVISTTYGAGDGSTTFDLPNMVGRVPIGTSGGEGGDIGAEYGADTVTLSLEQIPDHTHVLDIDAVGDHAHTTSVPPNSSTGTPGSIDDTNNELRVDGHRVDQGSSAAGAHTHTGVTTGVVGRGSTAAVSLHQPSLRVNYIIKCT